MTRLAPRAAEATNHHITEPAGGGRFFNHHAFTCNNDAGGGFCSGLSAVHIQKFGARLFLSCSHNGNVLLLYPRPQR
ncbi:hypothetical protein GA0061078_1705 [Bifidobacterium bohemicum]|uniref:Uncharacterized protein n=1 Tax=Bifidobacterium bohemicum DSM 22767 TaxID=1437606 RepID=A0A086ZHB3_9BIFI|nr:hypothetical protein BBOH_0720 [Bifidobacterium bohemicum DSM 22767]SCC17019.1 hypothetical protein GA0061078_1705 [Bifidobacterium bohemicum]